MLFLSLAGLFSISWLAKVLGSFRYAHGTTWLSFLYVSLLPSLGLFSISCFGKVLGSFRYAHGTTSSSLGYLFYTILISFIASAILVISQCILTYSVFCRNTWFVGIRSLHNRCLEYGSVASPGLNLVRAVLYCLSKVFLGDLYFL